MPKPQQTELAIRENEAPIAPTNALTPMDMIAQAIASGAGVEQLGKLMELQERYEASQARKAFNAAIAAAKAEMSPVVRNRSGHNSKKYADFAAIAEAVDPILSKNDLGYRFRSETGERINVTCILFHKGGHSEETTLAGPPDKTGNKNEVQAIGSTLTYLQRYSLVQALGLAATDDDDGVKGGDGPTGPITDDQAAHLISICDEIGADKVAFCEYFKIDGIALLPADKYQRAIALLEKKRAKDTKPKETVK
jgi:hypothetical protein